MSLETMKFKMNNIADKLDVMAENYAREAYLTDAYEYRQEYNLLTASPTLFERRWK